MAIEYYVRKKNSTKNLVVCETSEQAHAKLNMLPAKIRGSYAVFYSQDAIQKYIEDREAEDLV